MPVALHAIGTATPPYRYPQPFVRGVMGEWIGGERRIDKLLDRVYAASAIDARYSVLADFLPDRPSGVTTPFRGPDGEFRSPSTGERNALYAEHAPQLAERAARRTFEAAVGLLPAHVTHLITVSCTGFYTPGVDLHLVEALGLPPAVERYHLGFMGCFAAFPALRMAKAFCTVDPQAVVLVVTVELCTLHLQPRADVDSILAGAVFADGAAGVLVSAREPQGPQRPLALEHAATAVTREGAHDMAWTIGDHGFDMTLSAYVPRILAAEGAEAMAPLFAAADLDPASVRWWGVHPGGRAIVDKLVQAMGLQEPMVAASRAVLREAGNMSSATVLFVLERLMQRSNPGPEVGEPLVAVAFGPGLTVDSALLRAL